MTITIYNYDPITKEYESQGESYENPLNKDEPIIPANATTIKPLEHKKHYAIVWTGNSWNYIEDHRGEIWYNAISKDLETISFIGELSDNYYSPDSPIANPPEGSYWEFDKELNKWVGNSGLYKQDILNSFSSYWKQKLNTPYEFEEHSYLPSWRDLYTSIFFALSNGTKSKYTLQDANGQYIEVNKTTIKPIYIKMADIVDEMYTDKHELEEYFKEENEFESLQHKFEQWLNKQYV